MSMMASAIASLFRRRSKETSELRVTGLCEGNSPVTGDFPAKWPVTLKMFPFDDVIMYPVNQFLGWPTPAEHLEAKISDDLTSRYMAIKVKLLPQVAIKCQYVVNLL